MAKTSIKARQKKREAMVAHFADKRAALKAAGDYKALDLLPKNASPVRLKNRCQLSGRPRGYIRYFGCRELLSATWRWLEKFQASPRQAGNNFLKPCTHPNRMTCSLDIRDIAL